jgi:hypothetical protein
LALSPRANGGRPVNAPDSPLVNNFGVGISQTTELQAARSEITVNRAAIRMTGRRLPNPL